MGGNHLFDEIAIHEAGAGPLATEPPEEWFAAYLEATEATLAQYRRQGLCRARLYPRVWH